MSQSLRPGAIWVSRDGTHAQTELQHQGGCQVIKHLDHEHGKQRDLYCSPGKGSRVTWLSVSSGLGYLHLPLGFTIWENCLFVWGFKFFPYKMGEYLSYRVVVRITWIMYKEYLGHCLVHSFNLNTYYMPESLLSTVQINLFTSYVHSRWVQILALLYRWRKWTIEKLSGLVKVQGRVEVQTPELLALESIL